MANILIVGATGYVGQALSQSLIRSGNHRVFGLARSPEKARSLAQEEVIPILGSISPESSSSLISAINAHHIDTIVDVSGAAHGSLDLLNVVKGVGESRLQEANSRGEMVQKLGFIYCSGTWVHGSSHSPVNDLMPVGTANAPTPPAELVAWRTEVEKIVLAARDVLDVMVIRPALVYGRSCAIWTSLFEPLYKAAHSQSPPETVRVPADEDSRPGLVHVDDVASGFHAAIENLNVIAGTGVYPVFDLQTSQESMKDILSAAARELGFKGKVELGGAGEDLFARAMCTNGNSSSGRAKSLLGWAPRREGFVEGMGVFVKAWEASRA
jgi:nucleoside-diphosphate-sugar epimerase